MASRSSRNAAREALRARRNGLVSSSRMAEYEVTEDDNVFDYVQDDEYNHLVNRRREREDFVVDDDGLGYHDDGEENFFTDNVETLRRSQEQSKRRSKAQMTNKTLKKARRENAASAATAAAAADSKSMWEFVKPGKSGGDTKSGKSNGHGSSGGGGASRELQEDFLNSMLGELDDIVPSASSSSRRRGTRMSREQHSNRSRSSRSFSTSSGNGKDSGRRQKHRRSYETTIRRERYEEEEEVEDFAPSHQYDDGDANDNDDHDNAGVPFDDTKEHHSKKAKEIDASSKEETEEEEVVEDATNNDGNASNHDSSQEATSTETTLKEHDHDQDAEEENDEDMVTTTTGMKKTKRLRMKKSNLANRMSMAAKAAKEKRNPPAVEISKSTSTSASASADSKKSTIATSTPDSMDTNAVSFQPMSISGTTTTDTGSGTSSGFSTHASSSNLDSFLQTTTIQEKERTYVDMYWTDAHEKNGIIHLYGKTPVPVPTSTSTSTSSTTTSGNNPEFVSICTVVSGNQHNLFVLPRPGADMMAVHNEMKNTLQPKYIPHVKGAGWGSKIVKRKYAFGDESIPREETSYLKVVYDAKHPKPDVDVCAQGGEHFSKILNAGSTVLETFILKKKLMGPCWIRIYDPMPTNAPVSWCKVECTVTTPKHLSRCDLIRDNDTIPSKSTSTARPAPPLTTVTMKLKTVVNPKSNKSEIISVSAICHKNVSADTGTTESREQMSQLSLIRPLGMSISSVSGGLPHLPRDLDTEIKSSFPGLMKMPNERALLSRLMAQIGLWDPDILVGHNAWGYDMEVLLTRCVENKVMGWTKMGRRRNISTPKGSNMFSGKEWLIGHVLKGRLLCDTYVSSKELLRETMYGLTNLAQSQLKTERVDIEPVDVPQWFNKSSDIVKLAMHTLRDAELVQKLMFKLQVLPLTKQLTTIAGNLWGRTMKGNRAERNEYLLLHEFHELKFIAPEKARDKFGEKGGTKAKYSGGLVLEPKKGLYDTFILLLDFNSLYPSIIQEYNLCFTTMEWSKYVVGAKTEKDTEGKIGEATEDEEKNDNSSPIVTELPPLPEESLSTGVLPRVIKTLVQRRRDVKTMLKQEKNPEKKQTLDIRQTALKLTANSMYGCLGFSHSRFYAQPIAALITAMGRETLQRTVTIAEDTIGLDVIYGDTDSIMINTRISGKSLDQLKEVYDLGGKVKREVNKLYRTLELEVDGVFRSMLLLKKKKYAAITISTLPDGRNVMGKEMKGLDLVRRDWCIQSKESGKYVLDQILSCQDREEVVSNIHNHLEEIARKMRNNELHLDKYVITKGLSKHPDQYPDGKSQPHVLVAKMMLKANRPVNTGDHIPYVITETLENGENVKVGDKKGKSAAERARHPEEIQRSRGILSPDVEWYLTQQILPPISRLCETIDGTSQSLIAEKLGLDSTRYNQKYGANAEIDGNDLVDYTPSSLLPDNERFKDVEKVFISCRSCSTSNELKGVFTVGKDSKEIISGYQCPNPQCSRPSHWGYDSHFDFLNVMSNKLTAMVRKHVSSHGRYEYQCEDPSCALKTRQLSVSGKHCLSRGCSGSMKPLYSASKLDTQIKYLKSLFDIVHCHNQYKKKYESSFMEIKPIKEMISLQDRQLAQAVCERMAVTLEKSAYNMIEPSLFLKLFAS